MTNDPEFAEFADGEEPTRLDIPEQREPTMHPAEARLLKFLAEYAGNLLDGAQEILDAKDDSVGYMDEAINMRHRAYGIAEVLEAWKECK